MAEEIRLLARLLHPRPVLVQRNTGDAQGAIGLRDGSRLTLQRAKSVEDGAVRVGVDEGSVGMLAVDLDQRRTDRFQHLNADRLVVDEGARASIRNLNPAQDEVALRVDVRLGCDLARRVLERNVESGRNLALAFAVADEAAVAAPAESERKRVEQNRFAGPGLAGQNAEAVAEVEFEPVDQDDVADRKLNQHPPCAYPAALRPPIRPLKLRLIHDPVSSRGSSPPERRRVWASLYQRLSGKLCPSTAAAVCASLTIPSAI
jgi:hypothetical protein